MCGKDGERKLFKLKRAREVREVTAPSPCSLSRPLPPPLTLTLYLSIHLSNYPSIFFIYNMIIYRTYGARRRWWVTRSRSAASCSARASPW